MNFESRPSTLSKLATLFLSIFLGLISAPMQADPPPITPDKEYSSEMIINSPSGGVMQQKIYNSNGKIRTDMTVSGMNTSMIIRPDLQKMYSVMNDQKMVMTMPYDPTKMKAQLALASGQGSYEKIGPATINGVACTEYKYTSTDGKSVNTWIDTVRKVPVQVQALDHSFTITFKNYQAGPQPADLFEVPAGYTMMNMPSMPSMPAPGTPTPGQ